MAEPQNLQIIDELRFSTGMDIIPRLSFRDEIEAAVEKWYGQVEEAEAAVADAIAPENEDPGMEFISSSSLQRNIEAMQEMQAELLQKSTPAVRMVASTITAAATKQASDIHIEPQATDTVIRLRVDGMLRDFQRIPRSLQNSVVSRIKILADMDIAERRAPQDGRFMVKITGRKVDLRVSTLADAVRRESRDAVARGQRAAAELRDSGPPAGNRRCLTQILAQPQGMLLVTGPTGSGKSTTLYSSLNLARKPTVNIITVEDPVEYAVPGLNQVQVNTKAGLTFASCLRSILRQDPNVIMVGEIRDKETAEIAIKAAQTGHLVLSTLHTNDSISAVTRLLDLGIPGFQIATSVTGVIAQRLVRRLCSCHDEIPATPEYVSRLLQAGVQNPPATQHVPTGCDICDLTGYKGRVGIYEMLVLDEAIRSAVRSGGRNEEIRTLARHNGMKLMQEYALERVQQGQTTLDEVMRVVPFEKIHATLCAGVPARIVAGLPFLSLLRREEVRWRLSKKGKPRSGRPRSQTRMSIPKDDKTWSAARLAPRISSMRDLSVTYEGHSEDVALRPPDISTRGMFINTNRNFPGGRRSQCAVLSRALGRCDQHARGGSVLFAGRRGGVEFVDISADAVQAIEKEIESGGDHKARNQSVSR